VLRIIQTHGPSSRADVTRYSGISAPTVSKAVASLLRAGLLEEEDAPELSRGRPAKQLRLASRRAQVLGLVIDAAVCRLVSAGLDGKLHEDRACEFPTPATYAELIRTITVETQRLMMAAGVTTLGLGISIPGLIDYRRQRALLSPNVPVTNGHTPALDLGRELGIECVMLQETHALCLAERHYGDARGLDDFAMLDVSTGVGLGVMSGGRLLTGHSGLAGEVGHITVELDGRACGCGNRGCLETVASDSAFAWMVSQRCGQPLTINEILARARSGELSVATELQKTLRYLAIGLAAVINLFNPSTLFIHGELFALDESIFPRLVDETRQRTLGPSFEDCRVVQARGSKRQGAVAGIIEHLTTSVAPAVMRGTHFLTTEHANGHTR